MEEIKSNFKYNDKIKYRIIATNHIEEMSISNDSLKLILGRGYWVPVNTSINSDDGVIKITSDVSDTIDIRYVKNCFAYVIPLHNIVIISNNMRLCYVQTS